MVECIMLVFCTYMGMLGLLSESSLEHTDGVGRMLGIGRPKPSLSSSVRVEYAFLTIVIFFACVIVINFVIVNIVVDS